MKGRRVQTRAEVTEPGDYCYQDGGGGKPHVWFLLPIARDPDAPAGARAIHIVTSPPHKFRFCDDGSIEIRESIGAGPPPYYWHGYLDEGHEWRRV